MIQSPRRAVVKDLEKASDTKVSTVIEMEVPVKKDLIVPKVWKAGEK